MWYVLVATSMHRSTWLEGDGRRVVVDRFGHRVEKIYTLNRISFYSALMQRFLLAAAMVVPLSQWRPKRLRPQWKWVLAEYTRNVIESRPVRLRGCCSNINFVPAGMCCLMLQNCSASSRYTTAGTITSSVTSPGTCRFLPFASAEIKNIPAVKKPIWFWLVPT